MEDAGGTAPEARRSRRRWLLGAAGVIALVLVAVWAVWFEVLPDHRPDLEAGERYGVDVATHQGEIDWPRVAGDDIGFAYIKATEGGDWVDDRFTANWSGAAEAGLDRGAYHFFTLCRGGAEQAANFLATVPAGEATLPPALDLELAGNCSERPDREWVDREVGEFLDIVERETGEAVVLYIGADFDGHYDVRADLSDDGARPIWHRRILLRPDVEDWWIWQAHDRASIDGIDVSTDLNVMREAPPGAEG